MDKTPYLTTELPDGEKVLGSKIQSKLTYLSQIQAAINDNDDRLVYELLDSKRYNETIRKVRQADSNRELAHLVDDLQDELSHHLGKQLVQYLAQRFPFFFYEEAKAGVFQLYFGNWWDRRYFGLLDPLTISFIFDDHEFEMLTQAVALSAHDERYHTRIIEETTQANAALQAVISEQPQRDAKRLQLMSQLNTIDEQRAGLFGGRGNSDERRQIEEQLNQLDAADAKALEAPELIEKNNAQILNYSKADTILIYEQKAINDEFGDFANFKAALGTLYEDYLTALIDKTTAAASTPVTEV